VLVVPTMDVYSQCDYSVKVRMARIKRAYRTNNNNRAHLSTAACTRGSTGKRGTVKRFFDESALRRPCGLGGRPIVVNRLFV